MINTAWQPGRTTARVDGWWNGGAGAGGGGEGPIHRLAIGTAGAEMAESSIYVRVSPDAAGLNDAISAAA